MTTANKHQAFSRPFSQYQEHHRSSAAANADALTTVLVGPSKKRFRVDKHLLISSSPFFASQLAEASRRSHSLNPAKPKSVSLWLPLEEPTSFSLFVEWLSFRACFPSRVHQAINRAQRQGQQALSRLRWGLIRLHLIAANLSLWHLQDMAMDAVQDLYRRCEWDVAPDFVDWLYDAEDDAAVRMKRWTVAMMAFAVKRGSNVARFQQLLDKHSELSEDYAIHLGKMQASRLAIRRKDPRVRIDANRLQNYERVYGFRACSFHSHRAAAGEDRCTYTVKGLAMSTTDGESDYSQPSMIQGEEAEEEVEHPLGGLTAPGWSRRKQHGTVAVTGPELDSEPTNAMTDDDGEEQAEGDRRPQHDGSRCEFVKEDVLPPWPLFSRGLGQEKPSKEEQALTHMRSVSSVLA